MGENSYIYANNDYGMTVLQTGMKMISKKIQRVVAVGSMSIGCGVMVPLLAAEHLVVASGDDVKPLQPAKDYKKMSPEQLLELLSSEVFSERETAQMEAWKRGLSMLPWLQKAVESDDPELASRARFVHRNITIGVRFDTPKDIAVLIARFPSALLDEKEDILRELYKKKAYSYMLFMLHDIKNKKIVAKLFRNFRDAAHKAAQQALAVDNTLGALELFKIAPQTMEVMHSHAFLLARLGKLDAEITKLQGKQLTDEEKRWLLSLYIELGDRKLLRRFAQSHQNEGVLAALDLLEGNPSRSVDQITEDLDNGALLSGIGSFKKIYAGAGAESLKKQHAIYAGHATREAIQQNELSLNLLFMTGGAALAEPIFTKLHPDDAFEYLDYRERPLEALAAMGIVDDASLSEWKNVVLKELRNAAEGKNEKLGARELRENMVHARTYEAKILRLAMFYHSHGKVDKARDLVSSVLDLYQPIEGDKWGTFVAELVNYSLHSLAMDYILMREDKDIEKMVSLIFSNTSYFKDLWQVLKQRKGVTVKQSFEDVGLLLGMYKGRNQEMKILEKALLADAKLRGDASYISMLSVLLRSAQGRQDMITSAKFIDQVAALETDEIKQSNLADEALSYAQVNLDWERIIALSENQAKSGELRYYYLALQSIAQRKLGQFKKADELLEKACVMTAGEEGQLITISQMLDSAEDKKRVSEHFERQLLVHSESSGGVRFSGALEKLASGSSYYVHTGQWSKAAAMSMVAACQKLYLFDDVFSIDLDYVAVREAETLYFNLTFSRGMDLLTAGNDLAGRRLLNASHRAMLGDGVLADYFYPSVRAVLNQQNSELQEDFDSWVNLCHQRLSTSIKLFPKNANCHNTLAWILSRSGRMLDVGLEHARVAVKLSHQEAAYVDTLAEVWFAKKNRAKAIEWGKIAVKSSNSGTLLRSRGGVHSRTVSLDGQLRRFKKAPFSKN